jgi:hypothetical protein
MLVLVALTSLAVTAAVFVINSVVQHIR